MKSGHNTQNPSMSVIAIFDNNESSRAIPNVLVHAILARLCLVRKRH